LSDPGRKTADPELEKALNLAGDEDQLRVVVTLDTRAPRTVTFGRAAKGGKPVSRAELRKQAIEANTEAAASANTAAIRDLEEHGLTVRGSGLIGSLVVAGTSAQLKRALASRFIKTAVLDRRIELIEPVQRHEKA